MFGSRKAGRQFVGICTPKNVISINCKHKFNNDNYLHVRSSEESSEEAPIKSNERQLIVSFNRLLMRVCWSSSRNLVVFKPSNARFSKSWANWKNSNKFLSRNEEAIFLCLKSDRFASWELGWLMNKSSIVLVVYISTVNINILTYFISRTRLEINCTPILQKSTLPY